MVNRVVSILMQRNGLTLREAEAKLDKVREMIAECEYDLDETDEIMIEELGLEPDYLFDIL